MFPKFLLRKLYVKKSLKVKDASSFTFKIKNSIGKATLIKVDYVKIDKEEVDLEKVTAQNPEDGQIIKAVEVNEEKRVKFPKGSEVIFTVEKALLKSVKHQIEVSFAVKGLGSIKFDFSDVVE